MRFSILTTLVLAASLAACEPSAETTTTSTNKSQKTQVDDTDIGDVLADVNGMKVGSKAFEAAATRKVPKNGKELSTEEKQEVLKRLVDEKLLYQAALEKGLDRDPKVQKVMVNSLLREAVYANVKNSDFTDEDLQKYFDEHIDEFVVPEKVQIKRILIKVSDDRSDADAKKEAARLQGELEKDPSQFKALASAHSEDPYKRRGGDVGFVPKSGKPGLDQAIVDKAFTLDVEAISDVFKTDEGYNVITVANKRDKVERSFQQMKGSVLRKVKNDKLKNMYESYVGGLREGATVNTEDAKLADIKVKPAAKPKNPGFNMPTSGHSIPASKAPKGIRPPNRK